MALTVLSGKYYSGSTVLSALSWSAFLTVLSSQFCLPCSACSVLLGLFCLSCSVCPVLPVLFCLSCPACPILPVPFWMSVLFLAVLFRGCPVQGLSCPGCSLLAVYTYCTYSMCRSAKGNPELESTSAKNEEQREC
jgi:hypothetical protein